MTMEHRYPRRVILGDYFRAGTGLALTAGPLLLVHPASVMVYVLGGLAALFGVFGIRTAWRQATYIRADDKGIEQTGPFGVAFDWEELREIRLRYFSTRRDRADGWMQLSLRAGGGRLRIDSGIEDFLNLARLAAAKAADAGIEPDAATIANFEQLGFTGFTPGGLTERMTAEGEAVLPPGGEKGEA